MSPTPNEPTVAVQLLASDSGTRIAVFNSEFELIGSGVGRLRLSLERGVYKARFEAGNRMADELFEVSDDPVTVRGPVLAFWSPIPLNNTSSNHEYHYYPSRDLASKPPTASPGSGGEVFVFARDSMQNFNQPPSGPPQWQGLGISDAKHARIFDIEHHGLCVPVNGFASTKLALNPGLYHLEQPDCAHPDMMLKLPFVVCEGWCTHIYVDSKDSCTPNSPSGPSSDMRRVIDLAGAAMVMLRLNASSVLDDDVARLSEIARQGLMHCQEAVSADELEEMLEGKREFPMLGLYAAHVLLARSERNWEKVAKIAQHLARWLTSGHPDVDVLLALCAKHGITTNVGPSFKWWPPLLASGWDLAIRNDIGPGGAQSRDVQSRGDWQRQYRVGGSMWSCLYAPKRLAELTADRANRNTSGPNAGVLVKEVIKTLGEATGASDVLRGLGAAIGAAAGAPAKPQAPASAPASAPAPAPASAPTPPTNWKKSLATSLLTPNPESPPFEQAVRRRVLDLLDDEFEEVTIGDIGKHVESLASQFQVPNDEMGEVLGNLLRHIRS